MVLNVVGSSPTSHPQQIESPAVSAGLFYFPILSLCTKNALSDLHRRIAQATIQNTNTTKRDFVLKIKAFKDMNKNYLLFMFALNFNYP